jgi:uncharacterized surface protein with fasciclin (FAS1) repeats
VDTYANGNAHYRAKAPTPEIESIDEESLEAYARILQFDVGSLPTATPTSSSAPTPTPTSSSAPTPTVGAGQDENILDFIQSRGDTDYTDEPDLSFLWMALQRLSTEEIRISGPTITSPPTPSTAPSTQPSATPSTEPTDVPTENPSTEPSAVPSGIPSDAPSLVPSGGPSHAPSSKPSSAPSTEPSRKPSLQPTSEPSSAPSSPPTSSPTFADQGNHTAGCILECKCLECSCFLECSTSCSPFCGRKLQFQLNNTFGDNTIVHILADTATILDGKTGSFTLFAPTNFAFLSAFQFDPQLYDKLFVSDEFLPHLEDLLLYHTLEGELKLSDLAEMQNLRTLNIENVRIIKPTPTRFMPLPQLRVNGIRVVGFDNVASNGVVQIIEHVLSPAWVRNTIFDIITMTDDLSLLVNLLERTGLDEMLKNESSAVTFLAPTKAAFDAFSLFPLDPLDATNIPELTDILKYHIVKRVYTTPRMNTVVSVSTESGKNVKASVDDGIVKLNQATASSESILAYNGVLYVVDAVLNPDSEGGF